MSPSPVEDIQEVLRAINPSSPLGVPSASITMSMDDRGVGGENFANSDQPSDNGPSNLEALQPAGAVPTQPQSIWHKYVEIAEQWDQQIMNKWKTNLNNLLIFAALFTAIVTSFALDAMADLDEDTSTKLLRILVEQSTAGLDIDIPQPDIPPSIVMVNILWLLSITSSLAATTWAILSLEWCAFLTEGVQAEDYEEMAEKTQRRFEAVRRWKMHLVVVSIPFFLHISLFLFLAGLWLRLRDVNKQLELVVGIPSLVLASSYVVVTLLPMFTEAPFFTAASEMIHPFVYEFMSFIRLRHFIQAPPIFKWMSRAIAQRFSKSFPHSDPVNKKRVYSVLRAPAALSIRFLKYTYKFTGPLAYAAWTVVARIMHATLPTFQSGGTTFKELTKLQIGSSNRDKQVHQRALFRMMNTPLSQSEVKEVLKELSDLRDLGGPEKPMDRSTLKLLIVSLTSVLEDGQITEEEQPIFDHCTKLLTEEMGQAFREAKYDPSILVRNAAISNGLKKYVDFDTSTPPPQTPGDAYDEYWNSVVRLLWLSPSREQIRFVVEQLEPSVQSINPSLLQRIIRGLHAATLTSLEANKQQSILDFPLLDFDRWNFSDHGSTRNRLDLDRELSAFLRNLLGQFHKTAQPIGQNHDISITIPSLVVGCINLLDRYPWGDVPLKFHSALCLFITIVWRSDPGRFDTDPSVAQALVTSVAEFITESTESTPNRSEKIAIRLLTIANGPKVITLRQHAASETIASLYAATVRDVPECLSEYIHVIAATLEAILAKEHHPGVPDLRRYIDRGVVRTVVPSAFFTDRLASNFSHKNPDHRLPYLYSLAIAHSRGIGGTGQNPLELLILLRTLDGQQEGIVVEKTLDTNTLVATVLRRTLSRALAETELKNYLDPITQALQPLAGIIGNYEVYPWRTRWKSIYLLADIRNVLPRELTGFGGLQSLINATSGVVKTYIAERLPNEPAPSDWKMKKDGLGLCGLEDDVRGLAKRDEATEGVYSWREPGNIPYLSLYPQRTRYDLASQAPYRFLEKLQRLVDADTPGPSDTAKALSDPAANV